MKTSRAKKTISRRRVQFTFNDPQARNVAVCGDFNAWQTSSHPMKRNGEGLWQKIMMLPPGEYEYKFIVDGDWRIDPDNPQQCANRFGTLNHRLRVHDASK